MYHDVGSIREITCKKRDNCGKTKRSNLSQQQNKGDHGTRLKQNSAMFERGFRPLEQK